MDVSAQLRSKPKDPEALSMLAAIQRILTATIVDEDDVNTVLNLLDELYAKFKWVGALLQKAALYMFGILLVQCA